MFECGACDAQEPHGVGRGSDEVGTPATNALAAVARAGAHVFFVAFTRDSAFVQRTPLHNVREPGTPCLGAVLIP